MEEKQSDGIKNAENKTFENVSSKNDSNTTKQHKNTNQENDDSERVDIPILPEKQVEELQQQLNEKDNKYLRLYAEFDNFRKRIAKERIELFKIAGKDVIQDLLPILDDLDRAKKTVEEAANTEAIKEGISLITNKLISTLEQKGLKPMEVIGETFNPEFHEAVTELPAKSKKEKGKIIDEIQKGYTLNEKIIRYPKVVVGN